MSMKVIRAIRVPSGLNEGKYIVKFIKHPTNTGYEGSFFRTFGVPTFHERDATRLTEEEIKQLFDGWEIDWPTG